MVQCSPNTVDRRVARRSAPQTSGSNLQRRAAHHKWRSMSCTTVQRSPFYRGMACGAMLCTPNPGQQPATQGSPAHMAWSGLQHGAAHPRCRATSCSTVQCSPNIVDRRVAQCSEPQTSGSNLQNRGPHCTCRSKKMQRGAPQAKFCGMACGAMLCTPNPGLQPATQDSPAHMAWCGLQHGAAHPKCRSMS